MDPNVESDIYADKPWALSPMVASMNNLSIGTKTSGTTVKESHDGLDGMSFRNPLLLGRDSDRKGRTVGES